MSQAPTDAEIKTDIMNRLARKNCWGAKYLPLDILVNWLSKKVQPDGKRIHRLVKELLNEGYVILLKKGDTISLNPTRSREILDYINR